jgi:hypothetical protein
VVDGSKCLEFGVAVRRCNLFLWVLSRKFSLVVFAVTVLVVGCLGFLI